MIGQLQGLHPQHVHIPVAFSEGANDKASEVVPLPVLYDRDRPFGYRGGTFSAMAVEKARTANRPLTLDIAMPGRCLNKCVFCGYYEVNVGHKLSPEEIRDIFAQFRDLGGESVKVLGEGEPLLFLFASLKGT